MSDLIIRDGTGFSYRAKVDSENRVHANALAVREIANAAVERGDTYLFSTPKRTLIDTSEHPVLYIAPTPTEPRVGIFEALIVGWNGGSTNRDRSLIVRMYGGPGAPTANNETLTPLNTNAGSQKSAPGTYEQWDGGGAKMTLASPGGLMVTWFAGKGATPFQTGSVFVLPSGSSVAVTVEGEEVGDFSLSGIGFFKEA